METQNYKESSITGQKWTRAVRVQIDNLLNATPSILFVEEEAINLGERVITEMSGNLSAAFDLENPLHVEIYTKLNELYILLREARDAALEDRLLALEQGA